MPLRVPKAYESVPADGIRWVRAEKKYVWEQQGWVVIDTDGGEKYGPDDMVLMVKKVEKPKVKTVGIKGG
jgi:hypothetical protein